MNHLRYKSLVSQPLGGIARRCRRSAVVLLEVVLAMALFFGGALVILAGLSSSLSAIQRVQVEAQAVDLAVTLVSELQMGVVEIVSDGPGEYDDPALADWTWQIGVEPYEEEQVDLELLEFQQVTVTVRHKSGYEASLAMLMTDEPSAEQTGPDAEVGMAIPGGRGGGP